MIVKKIELYSYEQLLDFLKPGNALNVIYDNTIYRGQAIDWELTPLALRKEKQKSFYDFFDNNFLNKFHETEILHRLVEHNYLSQFFKYANNVGLKLPKSSFKNVKYTDFSNLKTLNELASCEWITEDLAEIAALAQHYGVPTRLLDWSFDIYVALYFASINAVKMIVNSELENYKDINTNYLIIWVLPHDLLEAEIDLNPSEAPPIRFVIPNYSNNPNICAQKGILSYWKSPIINIQDSDTFDNVCFEPLDALFRNYKYDFITEEGLEMTSLFKFQIPISESLTILKHVSSLGYNAATMFPGYYGVKQKIDEDILIQYAEPIFEKKYAKKHSIPTAAHDTTNNSGPSTEEMSESAIDEIKEAPKQEY